MTYDITINGIDVHAHYSHLAIDTVFLPLLRNLTKLQKDLGRRVLVMLAAPPGAGKSTVCSFLQYLAATEEGLTVPVVIGMDGFHRYQDYLLSHYTDRNGETIRMVDVKGAPETFDLPLLTGRIKKVAAGEVCPWPSYDRLKHNPQEDAVMVSGDIVLLEGNYLLLDEPGWKELEKYADYTVRITADEEMLRSRLIDRKTASGTDREKARQFVDFSDMYNVRLCLERTLPADLNLKLLPDGEYTL